MRDWHKYFDVEPDLSPPDMNNCDRFVTLLFRGALNAAGCEARTIPRPLEFIVSR